MFCCNRPFCAATACRGSCNDVRIDVLSPGWTSWRGLTDHLLHGQSGPPSRLWPHSGRRREARPEPAGSLSLSRAVHNVLGLQPVVVIPIKDPVLHRGSIHPRFPSEPSPHPSRQCHCTPPQATRARRTLLRWLVARATPSAQRTGPPLHFKMLSF